MRTAMVMAAILATPPAMAQVVGPREPAIAVSGEGRIKTAPDIAELSYVIVTEGITPDVATSALASKVHAINEALAGLSSDGAASETGAVSLKAAKSPDCKQDDESDTPRLSSGLCAYKGYIADMTVRVKIMPALAGTAVGLAARLGATEAEILGFRLRNPAVARAYALAAAMADARAKAVAIAEAGGARLGPLILAGDGQDSGGGEDIVVTAARRGVAANPPPIPIAIDPAPVETIARVTATFAILR